MAEHYLAVPQNVLMALEKAELFTLESILSYSNGDLMRKTGLNASQVRGLVQIASETLLTSNVFFSVHDMYSKYTHESPCNWGRLTTGCTVLDDFLHGGLLPSALTEISGTSGAGKTQLCLQLSLTVQLPPSQGGFKGHAVFVSTEGALPTGRLKQLSIAVSERYGVPADALLDNILIQQSNDVPSLILLLKHKLPELLQQNRCIKLILIDSLAAIFRTQYEASEMSERTDDLKTVISCLKDIIHRHKVTVACTNQMTANLDRNETLPALGELWSSCLNVRLVLLRDETVDNEEEFHKDSMEAVPRVMQVDLAPHLPLKRIQYSINNNGVFGMNISKEE